MSVFDGIIHQVQQNDLEQEKIRVEEEKAQRRLLRLQATQGKGLSLSELMQKIHGGEEKEESLEVKTEERPNEQFSGNSPFPAPPTAPVSKASS